MPTIRAPLRRLLLDAFHTCIDVDYRAQRINSERSLQASLWSQLNVRLPPERRMFIEPRLALRAARGRRIVHPDLVICDTRSVIAVTEIKYLPRGRPNHAKDLRTLRTIARQRDRLFVSNARFRGPEADAREYGFSPRTLFVWAGVHRPWRSGGELPLLSAGAPELAGCFLQLHAETAVDELPTVVARAG